MTVADKKKGVAQAAQARAELYDTLGQLEVRLNYAQRIDDAIAEGRARLARRRRDNPLAFAAAAAGVAVAAGLAVWGVTAAVVGRR